MAAGFLDAQPAEPSVLFSGIIASDPFATFWKWLFLAAAGLTVLIAARPTEFGRDQVGVFYPLLLSIVLGMFLMASTVELLMMYLAVELVSLVSYALAGYRKGDRKAGEAALKYVFYGGVASGIMLFGMSYIYGITGTPRVPTRNGEVTVTNVGNVMCGVGRMAIRPGSDPEFSLAPYQADAFTLVPGESRSITVQFDRGAPSEPGQRSGQLVFQTTDAKRAVQVVPLSALLVAVDCALSVAPANLDFGNVRFRSTPKANLTLSNQGSDPCPTSGVAFGPETDSAFTLGDGQPLAFSVDPGATRTLVVRFAAFDSTTPYLKIGTPNSRTGDPRTPEVTVPLAAYVNLTCVESSEWLYTVGRTNVLSRFDPTTATFTDIGQFTCPDASGANSMAVDQSGGIWVSDVEGKLFKLDPKTLLCEATGFDAKPYLLSGYGTGFVFDRTSGVDTLYIAGTSASTTVLQNDLLAVSVPSLSKTLVGPTEGRAELSGAGDGTLWGFFPYYESPNMVTLLVRLDPKTGATLERFIYPALDQVINYAMKFWGGSFWIFLGASVFRVDRTDPATIHTVITNAPHRIVGAGVSTCAPLL